MKLIQLVDRMYRRIRMELKTIVVVGGGYAGLHAVDSLRKVWGKAVGEQIRIILLDQNPYHFRKVLLVKAPIHSDNLYVPFDYYGWEDIELLQGELMEVFSDKKIIYYRAKDRTQKVLPYDQLILAVGSVMKQIDENKNGIVLQEGRAVKQIKQQLHALIAKANQTDDLEARKRILHVTVVGGGITGVEFAAEMAAYLRNCSNALGLKKQAEMVSLIHSGDRLIKEADHYVGNRLEKRLQKLGVEVIKNIKAIQFSDGIVTLTNGKISTGLCVWTLGTAPNPLVRKLGLRHHSDGRLLVDKSYRVQGVDGIYAIGDCARIIEPKTGEADGMNCKEAMMQAKRLGKVLKADVTREHALPHRNIVRRGYSVSLGPEDGFLWVKRLGINFIITGKIANKVKAYTWEMASTVS